MAQKYCPACGSPLDDDGICTKTTCIRRKLQLKQKSAREAAEKANERARAQ